MECAERSKDGASQPNGEFPFDCIVGGDDFDLGSWPAVDQLIIQSVMESAQQRGSSGQDDIRIQFATCVRFARADRRMDHPVDAHRGVGPERGERQRDGRVEEDIRGDKPLRAHIQDLSVGQLELHARDVGVGLCIECGVEHAAYGLLQVVGHQPGGPSTVRLGGRRKVEVLGDKGAVDTKDLLDRIGRADSFPCFQLDSSDQLLRHLVAADGRFDDATGEGEPVVYGGADCHGAGTIDDQAGGSGVGEAGENGLFGDEEGREVELFEQDLGHLLSLGSGVECRLG